MIKIGDLKITKEHKDVIKDILESERITEGKYVALFEREVEKYLGVKHCIAVTNGTVALQLVSQLVGDDNGKLVVVPALTFPATANAFLLTGQEIALCDIDETLLIDITTLSEEQKHAIDIIVPVHLMGYMADMEYIMEEATKYNWIVIEDTAEAFGAELNGKKAGTFGHFGTFSFFVSHNIWGGELGCIVTNDDEDAERLRSTKNHGRTGDPMKFLHKYVGSNYKTNEFCAGLAYVNLKHADEIIAKRLSVSEEFELGITNERLTPYAAEKGFSPLGYPIQADTEEYRDEICKKLNDAGIETRNIFPCLANQECYDGLSSESYPVANDIEKRVFYIGCHQYMTKKDVKKVLKVINDE